MKSSVAEKTSDEMDIKAKVHELISDSLLHSYLNVIDFELELVLTRDMKWLLDGATATIHEEIDEEEENLSFLRLESAGKEFLRSLYFPSASKIVYFRHFYESLYQVLLKHWSSERALVLTGNPGTGKSWFQAYALRRLAQDTQVGTGTYKFVVRQLKDTFFLHDLSSLNVYKIKYNNVTALETVVNGMTKTLYFFEPGEDKNLPPKYFTIPSLSTLSQNQERIKDYAKHRNVKFLFFPVWSFSEYYDVGAKEGIDPDELEDRYDSFGGILGHLFCDKYILQKEVDSCLGKDTVVQLLKSEVKDVDIVTGNGKFSGHLVCYIDVPYDGDQAFESRSLTVTSKQVKGKMREIMYASYPMA
jgi:tRNA A37 threonylcarbamoyladenosine biosynthesis protein TsaE